MRRFGFLTVLLATLLVAPQSSFAQYNGLNASGGTAMGTYLVSSAPANGLIVSGKVGIGTPSPATSLDLSGNSDGLKLQTASAALNATCTSTMMGAIRYNSNLSQVEFCNGSNWLFLAAGGGSGCTAPTGGVALTNVTGATLGAFTANGVFTPSGCSSSLAVSVSGSGSPQISINGGAWVTAGTLSAGQTLNIGLTASSLSNTPLTATLYIGTASYTWTVTTLVNCTVTPGTVCSDGTVYAGLSPDTNVPMYIAPCDEGQTFNSGTSTCSGTRTNTQKWAASGSVTTSVTSQTTGKANTATLYAWTTPAGDLPYYAASHCASLSNYYGHSDWYLPALGELNVLWNNYKSSGPLSTIVGALDASGSYYWSSSEQYPGSAFDERFSDGNQSTIVKTTSYEVRCVRR